MAITGMIREPPRSAKTAKAVQKQIKKHLFWLKGANYQESSPQNAAHHHEGHESSLPGAATNHEGHDDQSPQAARYH